MGSTVSGEYSSPLLVVVIADADVRFRVGALFFLSGSVCTRVCRRSAPLASTCGVRGFTRRGRSLALSHTLSLSHCDARLDSMRRVPGRSDEPCLSPLAPNLPDTSTAGHLLGSQVRGPIEQRHPSEIQRPAHESARLHVRFGLMRAA